MYPPPYDGSSGGTSSGGPGEGAGAREMPICVALILCDLVIEDRRTGNKSLIGLFHGISANALPAIHSRLFLVASVTSGRGPWAFAFRITAPSGQELMRMEDTVQFPDPLEVHDLVVEVRSLPVEEEGVYHVDFLIDGTPTMARRFHVRREPEGSEE